MLDNQNCNNIGYANHNIWMCVFIIIFPTSISIHTDQSDVHKIRIQNARLSLDASPWILGLVAGAKWALCTAPHSALPRHFLLPTNL